MQSDTPSGDAPADNRPDSPQEPPVTRVRGLSPHEVPPNAAARPPSADPDARRGDDPRPPANEVDANQAGLGKPGAEPEGSRHPTAGVKPEDLPSVDAAAATAGVEAPPDAPNTAFFAPVASNVADTTPTGETGDDVSTRSVGDEPNERPEQPPPPTGASAVGDAGRTGQESEDDTRADASVDTMEPGDHDSTALAVDDDPIAEAPPARLRLPLPRVLAVANQKGGVGKTTTTVNVAACLAELGHRTLLVDLDPQANATTGLGLDPRALTHSVYHVMLHNVPADSCIEPTEVKNLFVLPSSLDLAGAEIELVPALSREHRLRLAIESVIDDYDYVLIDCPPSLGLLTINALTAAKEILVPIQCEYYALEGLGQLLHNVELVTTNLNPTLQISHIVLVMFDSRTKLAGQVVDEVREHFGEIVCENVIPRTVRLSEAPSFGQPITTFDTASTGAAAYRAVTKEVIGGQT